MPGKPQPKVEIPTTITDVTGREDEFTLDVQGFHYVKHESQVTNWDDDEEIKRVNYPEMEKLCWKIMTETENLYANAPLLWRLSIYSPIVLSEDLSLLLT